MVFCTSCGEELPPGSKFCENCGAPVESAIIPLPAGPEELTPAPALPEVVPSPPVRGPLPVLPIAGILVLFAIIAAAVWFVGLPYLQKGPASSVPTPIPTAVPIMVTATQTLPPETTAPQVRLTPTARKLDPRYEEYYDEIYYLDQFFAYGQKVTFAHDLTAPPLFIKYNLTPNMITRTKVINIGLSSEQTITTTYQNPNAWFEIKVLDSGNGAIVEAQGYGRDYPDVTKDEFMVRNAGNYLIEMSGNEVTADISIMKGKE